MSREDTVSASVDHVLVTIAIWLGCGVAAALAMLALGVLVGRALRANSAHYPPAPGEKRLATPVELAILRDDALIDRIAADLTTNDDLTDPLTRQLIEVREVLGMRGQR